MQSVGALIVLGSEHRSRNSVHNQNYVSQLLVEVGTLQIDGNIKRLGHQAGSAGRACNS